MAPSILYEDVRLHVESSRLLVTAAGSPHAISINTSTNEVSAVPSPGHDGRRICGVMGTIQLPLTSYLIVITEKEEVGAISGHNIIWKMSQYELIPYRASTTASEATKALNEKYLGLLNKALTGQSFYFSFSYDVTHTLQRLHNVDESFNELTYMERADERFVWNRYLIQSVEMCSELAGFVLPVVYGVLSITTCSLNGKSFDFILFSRRNWHRTGVRYFVRGTDTDGNVANNVETEQIVRYNGQVASHVNTRGSIPLYWSQRSNITYKPFVKLHKVDQQKEVFVKHMQSQVACYGSNVMINLIDDKGKEKEICQSLSYIAGQSLIPNVRYIHFDFHKQCSKMRWYNLQLLMDDIKVELDDFGYFFKDNNGNADKIQSGVFRTNCIDCLDRTNVVQGLIGRYVLVKQFIQMGILGEGETIPDTAQFEFVFKNRWADNGDGIAKQYTNTPALKSDYTRTGVRTKLGLCNDGYKSMCRYVQNNFLDGHRQDSYDLLVGNHRYSPQEVSPLSAPKHPVAIILPAALAVFFSLFIMKIVMPEDTWSSQLSHLALYIAVMFFLFKQCVKWGDHLVDQPRLYHTLAQAKND